MTTYRSILFCLICVLTGCFGCGTLGGFTPKTFETSNQNVVRAIDTFYSKNPEYQIPKKWEPFDDWKERGYSFLDSRIFYFKIAPEEMYYVSFIGDANDTTQLSNSSTSLSIRAINNGKGHWTLENEINSSEKTRIEERFDKEIISKIQGYINNQSGKK